MASYYHLNIYGNLFWIQNKICTNKIFFSNAKIIISKALLPPDSTPPASADRAAHAAVFFKDESMVPI